MATNSAALGSRGAHIWSSVARLTAVCIAALLLTYPIGVLGREASAAGAGPSSDDWITINKDYSGQRYVDVDQITPANVSQLKEVCEIRLNEPNLFSSGILKIGSTLYTSTSHASYAFDATTCELRWLHAVVLKQQLAGTNSHGLGYFDGKIFRGTTDGQVIALDATTGKLLWDVQAATPANHEAFTSAPIAWQQKVFIGIATSDLGIAGRLMALDASTGKELWRFNTTLGSASGGGFWTTYSLDPKTGELFGSVANPYPDFNRDITPDDKTSTKYTNSVISVDAGTGKLNWSYQVVPRDEHDWDLSPAPTLYTTSAGEDMAVLAGKSGRVYAINRATQSLAFNTPATTIVNDQEPLDENWKYVCPGLQGGAMFNGAAYHSGTGALYVGMSDHCAWFIKNKAIPPDGGLVVKDWSAAAKLRAPRGWITAIDSQTGAVLWQYHAESQVLAGLVPTKSGLLFAGDTHGNLLAFDAETGSLLRSIDVGGALNSGLISYSVGGDQYVAVTAGGPTENPSTVAGPLRVVIYGLKGSDQTNIVRLERLGPFSAPGFSDNHVLFIQSCAQCHGLTGAGSSAPPLARQSQLADPALLKQFLATVPPPMPRLYPGLLEDKDVEKLAEFLRTDVFKCGPSEPQSCRPAGEPATGGTQAWQAIYSVLTSPRCINCHPVSSRLPAAMGSSQDYPRQGDDRHPHYYGVVRGDVSPDPDLHGAGMGTPYARCTFCHGAANNPATGIPGTHTPNDPGRPFWALAPASMAWESAPGIPMTGTQLCAQLQDRTRNGNRTLSDLLEHLEHEPLVNWSFNPGTRPNGETRTPPPISHAALVQEFKIWMQDGAPCPGG
jgi:alcohol dehydrogenase (cytochrome c)